MSMASTVHTILYAVAAFWSLLVWTVAAGFVGKINDYFGAGSTNSGTISSANATLAWGLISFIYFVAALVVLLWVSPTNIFVSIMLDTAFLGFLWLFGIVSVGVLSTWASTFSWWGGSHNRFSGGSLGSAVLGLGWILVLLQLGLLVFEVVFVLVRYGCAFSTWRQSFYNLTNNGNPFARSDRTETKPTEMGPVTTAV